MAGYKHYLNIVQKYIEIVKNSSEHIRKTVFVITVGAVTSLFFIGWVLTSNFFSSSADQIDGEEQAKELSSDVHSIVDAFQERLDKDKGKYSTPPVYFLDTGEMPTTTK